MGKYSELLKTYITNSDLSLREISRRCDSRGTPVSQAYISKLLKEDVPPASEDINRALAEVTGGDPEQLIMAGYIEKAPEEVQKLLEEIEDINDFLQKTYDFYMSFIDEEFVIKELRRLNADKEIEKIALETKREEIFQQLTLEEKLEIINILKTDAESRRMNLEELIGQYDISFKRKETEIEKIPVGKRIMLPVIGVVKAGPNGLAYEDPLGEEPVDEDSINGGKYFWLKVKGDSMVGDMISEGDLVLVREQPEVESGQLGVVIVDGEEGTLKRIYKTEDSIVLQSSNPAYPPRIFTGKDMKLVRIVGRAKEIKRKL